MNHCDIPDIWRFIAEALLEVCATKGATSVVNLARTCKFMASIIREPGYQKKARKALARKVTSQLPAEVTWVFYQLPNGKMDGEWYSYDKDKPLAHGHFKDGRRHGKFVQCEASCLPEMQAYFHEGELEGEETVWCTVGGKRTLIAHYFYKGGKSHGENQFVLKLTAAGFETAEHHFATCEGELVRPCGVPGCGDLCYHLSVIRNGAVHFPPNQS